MLYITSRSFKVKIPPLFLVKIIFLKCEVVKSVSGTRGCSPCVLVSKVGAVTTRLDYLLCSVAV